jgi:AcrR family transcriptional regulator
MPKIIENIREMLLSEAKRQISENGYKNTTIRSVASACGVGVGTVYNYFQSKDMLIATFMLEDWQVCLASMKAFPQTDPESIMIGICNALRSYMSQYQSLFADSDANKVFASVFSQRHKQLRIQIAEIIYPACEGSSVSDKKFLAEYIAESLLTWTVAGKSASDLLPILKLLF